MLEKDERVLSAFSAIVTIITEYALEHMSAQDALREIDFDRFVCAFLSATNAIIQRGNAFEKKLFIQLQ